MYPDLYEIKKYEGKVITNFILKMLDQDFFSQ
jgi:hypothetical protein